MVDVLAPYAQALYESAVELGKAEAVCRDLEQLDPVWKDNPEFCLYLQHPGVSREDKDEKLDALFRDQLDPVLLRFYHILNSHQMAGHIPGLYEAWQAQHRKARSIEIVGVESAGVLEPDQLERLQDMLEKRLGHPVQLEVKIVPELIAGLRVRSRDFLLDNSVASRLESMKEQLVR